MNDMDAFKELQKRMPNMEVMNIEQLHGLVFWAGAGAKWARLQIETAKNIGGMQAQVDAWMREGQIAGELEIKGQQRLGKIAKETEKTYGEPIPPSRGGGRKVSVESPKWQRLGFKSESAMKQAEFLEAHPEEVDEVITEAKEEDDLPSKGAVKNKVRAKRAEEAYARERKKQREEPQPLLSDHLQWCIEMQHEINIKLSQIMRNKDQVDGQSMMELAKLIRRAAELIIQTNEEKQKWQKLLD